MRRLAPILALLTVASSASAWNVTGDVHHAVRNDTLIVRLDLEFFEQRPDSVRIFTSESDHRFSLAKPSDNPPVMDLGCRPDEPGSPLRWAGMVGEFHRLVGELRAPLDGRPVPAAVVVDGMRLNDEGEWATPWWGRRIINPRTLSFGVIPFISWGLYEAELPGTPQRDGMIGGFAFAADLWRGNEKIFLHTDVTLNFDEDEPFNFSESAMMGWRHHFGSFSADWRPALEAGYGFVSLKNRRGETDWNDSEFGGRFGAALLGPFMTLGYDYGTALGGYHRGYVEMLGLSAGLQRAGTRYEYVDGEGFRTLRVSIFVEGLAGWGDSLNRADHRPLALQLLSWAGILPLTPLALVGWILGPGV